jgi:hypothetical protein
MDDYQQWLAGQDQFFALVERAGFKLIEEPKGLFRLFAKWKAI